MSTTTATQWQPRDHVPQEVLEVFADEDSFTSSTAVISILHVIEQLKLQKRTGWIDHGVKGPESIADHMYRMSITSMLIRDPKVDRNRCVRIALVHDMAEALVGDITPDDPNVDKAEKHRRELATINFICDELIAKYNRIAADEIRTDWLAYENIESLEARYVKDIDKFEMLVQCFEYEKRTPGKALRLDSFWRAMNDIKTDEVKGWALDLQKKRDAFFQKI